LQTNFISQNAPSFFAKKYKKDGLFGGHIIMLDNFSETKNTAIEVLKEFPNRFRIGGGINEKNAQKFLRLGAEKVIVSSGLFDFKNENPSKSPFIKGDLKEVNIDDFIFLQAKFLSEKIRKNHLVLDLSCKSFGDNKKYFVMIHGWKTQTNFEVNLENLEKLSQYASEFLIHGVSVEGKNAGFDEGLVRILTRFKKQNKILITYAGGIHSLKDLEYFLEISENLLDFTIGSSLEIFGGGLWLKEILEILKN